MICEQTISWIPVAERLPPPETWCLAVALLGPESCAVLLLFYHERPGYIIDRSLFSAVSGWRYVEDSRDYPVSHWAMPPMPPSECLEGGLWADSIAGLRCPSRQKE